MNVRPNSSTAYITLRDPAADMSLQITCPRELVHNAPVKLTEGTQVIMLGRPNFFVGRGSFSLRVNQIRAVGVGELLARIDRLRKLLAAEGLFDPRLKRPIPFLPSTIGLITGRASAAERDVVTVATSRWPAVRFDVRNAAVQGPGAVPQIVDALRELDRDGSTSMSSSSPVAAAASRICSRFSDETLCREIAKCTTPVVSAIGHEPDNPLCDLVADVRAATPTDAAKQIVPDATAEQALITDLRRRSARALRHWVHREQHILSHMRSRPVLAQPLAALDARDRRDPPGPSRREAGRHPVGGRRVRSHRALVGAADDTRTSGHPGPRLRRSPDGRGRDPSLHRRCACGHATAGPSRRWGCHRRK